MNGVKQTKVHNSQNIKDIRRSFFDALPHTYENKFLFIRENGKLLAVYCRDDATHTPEFELHSSGMIVTDFEEVFRDHIWHEMISSSQVAEMKKELLINEVQVLFSNVIKAMDEFSFELKKLVDSWQSEDKK